MDNRSKTSQSRHTEKMKTAKFVPYEPTKAATGPVTSSPLGPASIRRYNKLMQPPSAPKVPRPDNLFAYPKPYTIIHHEQKDKSEERRRSRSHNDSILEILTPENTPSVERKLVLQDLDCQNRTFDSEYASKRSLFPSESQLNITETLNNATSPCMPTRSRSSSNRSSPPRPVNKVDPLMSSCVQETSNGHDLTTIDISDLEMHEIDRLRRLNKSYLHQICELNQERNEFKRELDAQFQVNTELKKLLVASIGEDLQHRVERIIREKAHMKDEIGDYHRKMSLDIENLDKVSIQADMWRSKFLASRVMIDELALWKAHLSLHYKELQKALHDLFEERNILKTNLNETYRCLQQVKDAFLPNPMKIHSLRSQTVTDVARMNTNLASEVKQRLLGNAKLCNDFQLMNLNDKLTPAEQHADKILRSPQFQLDQQEPTAQSMHTEFRPIDRFHPNARYEHVTVNCCKNCHGEIHLI